MTELYELTDGKTIEELERELTFQIQNGELAGGTICSHIEHEINKKYNQLPLPREISTRELADLSTNWENPTVDTSQYYQCVLRAWQVNKQIFLKHRSAGGFCQVFNGKYYIA